MFDSPTDPLFEMDEYEKIPTISKELADYLAAEFSADIHIDRGLLRDPNVVRSEGYLLGFLAGLQYAQQTVRVMLATQDAKFLDE